jgi:hypothetical protein
MTDSKAIIRATTARMTALVYPARLAKLAGAETESLVPSVAPRVLVGQRGNAERAGMGGHVEPVGEQRHGAERQPCDDLADHHGRGERDHELGATLVAAVIPAETEVEIALE